MKIKGFITREEAGLVKPESRSSNITPEKGGVASHWAGPNQKISSHSDCIRRWRGFQKYHIDKGWVDIAYTLGYCRHGYAFAGRGVGVRTAANGTNFGNQNYYAVVYIGGEGDPFTREALDAFLWCVNTLRKSGAGSRVVGHSDLKNTGCPGPLLTHARDIDRKAIGMPNEPSSWAKPSWEEAKNLPGVDLVSEGDDPFDKVERQELMVFFDRAGIFDWIKAGRPTGSSGEISREEFDVHRHPEGRTGPPI